MNGRNTPRFDVVVVGGGSSGCVLTNLLSQDSRGSVALVEAGPITVPVEADGGPRTF